MVESASPSGRTQGRRCASLAPQRGRPKSSKSNDMKEDLQQVADMVAENVLLCTKNVLTAEETARYMGVSMSHLYKLTSLGKIPHYKPKGKMCYFNRAELEQWLQRNRVSTESEISEQAARYCMQNGRR